MWFYGFVRIINGFILVYLHDMKHFLSLFLIINTVIAFGQNFLGKPYLEMRTVEDQKEKIYRLKKNTVWIKTVFDTALVKDKITGFSPDSGIVFKNHGVIDPHDIEMIRFTPGKFSRTVKQLIYIQGLVIEGIIITSIISVGFKGNPDVIFALYYPIFTVAIAEGLGALSYVTSPKKVLRKTDTQFIIQYRYVPPPYVSPSPYMVN